MITSDCAYKKNELTNSNTEAKRLLQNARNRQFYARHAEQMRQRARDYWRKNRPALLEKKRIDSRAYYAKYRQKIRHKANLAYTQLRKGITREQWDTLFESQGRCCKVCKSPEPLHKNGWHIDHDHFCCNSPDSCGKCIRGILCGPCNMALGFARENVERLYALAAYVERFRH